MSLDLYPTTPLPPVTLDELVIEARGPHSPPSSSPSWLSVMAMTLVSAV